MTKYIIILITCTLFTVCVSVKANDEMYLDDIGFPDMVLDVDWLMFEIDNLSMGVDTGFNILSPNMEQEPMPESTIRYNSIKNIYNGLVDKVAYPSSRIRRRRTLCSRSLKAGH